MYLAYNQKMGNICRKERDQQEAGQETWRRAVILGGILGQSIMTYTYENATVKFVILYINFKI